MEKKDLPKQQRRKRKDPQSRDFKCKCGKSYLSYAAVYTHVKNKHNNEKQFQESIVKPQKQKLKRGRPKDKKQIILSNQTQTLSICQQATLLIYEQLKQKKDNFNHNIILQGNEEMNQTNFNNEYKRLNQNKALSINLLQEEQEIKNSQPSQDQEQSQSRIFENFIKGVIKHFSAQIAAKVAYTVNYFAELSEQFNFEDKNQIQPHIGQLNELNIWDGQNQINEIIYSSMKKWLNLLRKQEAQE